MRIDRDLLWKGALRLYLQDFYAFFFPKSYHRIDWTRGITFLDKELQKLYAKSNQKDRVADVLVRLYLKSGKAVCILLHVEIQGYTDSTFAFRFHQMRYRIEERFAVNPLMLAVYTDNDPNFHPKQYQNSILGSKTLTVFNTYKVMDNPPALYKDPNSAVSIIMEVTYHATKTKGLNDDEIMNLHFPIVHRLFKAGFPRQEVEFLMSFIQKYVKFDNDKNYSIFEQNIDDMAKYETTEDILAVFDTTLQLKKAERRATAFEQKYERELERTERERERTERERQEKERERQEKEYSILLLLRQGLDKEIIAKVVNVTVEQITQIQEKYKDNNPIDNVLKN